MEAEAIDASDLDNDLEDFLNNLDAPGGIPSATTPSSAPAATVDDFAADLDELLEI